MNNIYTNLMTVNYSDVDENNVLSNVGILRMFQETGAVHCDLLGYGPNNTPSTHVAWIILNWKLKVFSRPKWNTKLTIKTWSKTHHNLFCYRNFEMYDDNDILVSVANSKWVLLDCIERHLTKITKEIEERFNCLDKPVFNEKTCEKLEEPINSKEILDYIICRRDIDTNHHVNNLNYLIYAYETLPKEVFENTKFSNVEIMYKHEAKLGDKLSFCYAEEENNEHVVTIKNKEENTINAIIKLY